MRTEQYRLPDMSDSLQYRPYFDLAGRVDTGRWFVKDEYLRVVNHRTRQRKPLPHTFRIGADPVVGTFGQSYQY